MAKQNCEICDSLESQVIYSGPIRDMVFGVNKEGAEISECSVCGAQRLSEDHCIPESYYGSGEYRTLLEQSLSADKALLQQDELQRFTFEALWPSSLRGMAIMDVGCGVGSFLDMARNISDRQVAIEPCSPYRTHLRERGYSVYSSLEDAEPAESNKMDWAFSIHVIEHVRNPQEFLVAIRKLLKPGARALISTPNRNEILMKLLPDEFRPFFYRTAHRWYFDEDSLRKCSELAGFKVLNTHHVHRYGMSNTLYWLRDKKPKGRNTLPGINVMADQFWKGYLEDNKQGDTIYMELQVSDD